MRCSRRSNFRRCWPGSTTNSAACSATVCFRHGSRYKLALLSSAVSSSSPRARMIARARTVRARGSQAGRAAPGPNIKGPILADRAPRTFGLGDAGFPAWGPHQAPQRPNHPYEDVTSTEARQRLVNGSPPFRGNHLREDPTSPVLRAARAREVRARLSARWKQQQLFWSFGRPLVNL